jgi:hypothetical protein
MRIFGLFSLLLFVLVGCDKPHPNPELLDPIYADLLTDEKKIDSELKGAQKELEGFVKELNAVAPQTGQVKYAQKRVDETRARVLKLEQMRLYYQIRIQSRKRWAQDKYTEAYRAKKSWPESKELEQYKVQKKMEQAPRTWGAKARLEQAKIELKQIEKNAIREPASQSQQK